MDLLFPKKNAEALIEEAKALGHKETLLCYDDPKKIPENTKAAIIITDRRKINGWKNKGLLLGPAQREFFEDKRITGIISPGLEPRKDHTHFRRSLTQVEATLATKQNKTIYFLLSDLHNSKHPEELLGRWLQDFRVLKKYNTPFVIVTGASTPLELRSRKDLEAFTKIR